MQDKFVDIPSLKYPYIHIDPVYSLKRNFTGQPLDWYIFPTLWTWESISLKLKKIAEKIFREHHLHLLVKDAYRPIRASSSMVQWAYANDLSTLVPTYISPPWESQHNNGSAIDMTLANSHWEEIWMWSNFDEFNEHAGFFQGRDIFDQDHREALGGKYAISDLSVYELRTSLRNIAFSEWLLPYDEEWWHFFDPIIVCAPFDKNIDSCIPPIM